RRVQFGRLRRLLLLAGLLSASIQLAAGAATPTLIERPNADSDPTQVSVAIWVVDINNIDSAQQNFAADLVIVLRWSDPRLAHGGGGVAHYPLDQIWHPRVAIVNETNAVSRKFPESAEVDADGTVVYRQRFVGSFTQPLHLNSFPFDEHTFRVRLRAVRRTLDAGKFVTEQRWLDDVIRQRAGMQKSITVWDM